MRLKELLVLVTILMLLPLWEAGANQRNDFAEDPPLRNWPVVLSPLIQQTIGPWAEGQIAPTAVPSAASHFITVVPCRVVDTRNADGPFGGPKLMGGTTRSFLIPAGPCAGIPAAAAYSLNLTVTQPEANDGFIKAWPTGSPEPLVATLNFNANETKGNAAIVPADDAGSIDIFSNVTTHLIIDINGYFSEGPMIARATGLGPDDQTNVGRITSRTVSFTKRSSGTALRISYTDNRRVIGPDKAGRWEIRANGASCPGGALVYDYYVSESSNNHHSETVVGYCEGLGAGTHSIQVWVGPVPGYSNVDVYTGWSNSRWVLEVEELP